MDQTFKTGSDTGGFKPSTSPSDTARSIGNDISAAQGKIADAASTATAEAKSDIGKLQDDIAGLKETMTTFMAEVSGQTSRTFRNVSDSVSQQVQTTATDIAHAGVSAANAASDQVKTFASEMETMGRKNPLGAMAGALLVGVVIGLLGRRG